MQTRFKLVPLYLVLLTVIPVSVACAQSSLRELFDSSTIGYARVDLERLDVDATAGMTSRLLGDAPELVDLLKERQSFVKNLAGSIRDAGGVECFAILSLNVSLREMPALGIRFFIKSVDNDSRQKIADVAQSVAGDVYKTRILDGGVLLASDSVMQRLVSHPLQTRNDCDELFKLHEGSDLAFVFAPSSDQRRALREVWANSPKPFERITGAMIADGANRSVLRVNPNGERTVELVVQGADEVETGGLAKEIHNLLQQGTERKLTVGGPAQELWDAWSEVFAELKLEHSGNRISIVIDKSDGGFDRLCESLREPVALAVRSQTSMARSNWMRQILLACHSYHDANKALPTFASFNEKSNPLLSWRVLILPYIDEFELYRKFHLNEPWDSEHNKTLIAEMPRIYRTEKGLVKDGKTTFVMPVGEGLVGQKEPVTLSAVPDGTSNTIMLLDVAPAAAVVWTRPDDWQFDSTNPLRGLFVEGQLTLRAGFIDASVHMLEKNEDEIRSALTIAGGEVRTVR